MHATVVVACNGFNCFYQFSALFLNLYSQEAAELASLKPQFDAKKVALYAVVHEKLGVPEFKYFFEGKVLFDPKVIN